jgi:hypothetical protein
MASQSGQHNVPLLFSNMKSVTQGKYEERPQLPSRRRAAKRARELPLQGHEEIAGSGACKAVEKLFLESRVDPV